MKLSFISVLFFLFFLTIIFILLASTFFDERAEFTSIANDDQPKVLCMILSSEKSFAKRCPTTWNTWAKKCTNALFFLNSKKLAIVKQYQHQKIALPESLNEYANLSYLPVYNLNITENYNKMAEKVLLVLKLSYMEFHKSHDWFLLADDDTFVFTKHLYKFVSERSSKEPLTYGYNFKHVVKTGYQSGGAGVLFTHESMKRMYNGIVQGKCNYTDGYGDVATGRCMANTNVKMGNSLDPQGRERFANENFRFF
jgi:glycoprotein-N-acetylgalactosamine 3-beta-galactosyltransferase